MIVLSIKPIDFQVMIPKTSEISKMQNEQNNRPDINQQHTANAFQKEVDQRPKKVNSSSKALGDRIREKEKDARNQQQRNKDKNKDDRSNKKNKKNNTWNSIDILI